MRKVTRVALKATTVKLLDKKTALVVAAADPKALAGQLWDRKPTGAFADVRAKLETMAFGRARCMYCEDSAGTDIDHFRPKALYPGQAFTWDNYLLACSYCNSNLKVRIDPLDATGARVILDPSLDDPALHLEFAPTTGDFAPLTPEGAETIDVFGLNDKTAPRRLPDGRRATLLKLQVLLIDNDQHIAAGRTADAQDVRKVVVDEPFSAVLAWLVTVAKSPGGPLVLRPGVPNIIAQHGVARW